ncbi:bifunctional heptose 7-phosphate kinase/heptose 1-phosphate adenyltransferase [Candidatus Latescibacterota bacterium]
MNHADKVTPSQKKSMLSVEHLENIIRQFDSQRIAVFGDFFLDKYLDIDHELVEKSVETGKTAHQVTGIRHSPGAAGNVAANLASLGAGTLHAVGVIGDDGEGYELTSDLNRLGCTTDHLLKTDSMMTPTYMKPRNNKVRGLEGEHDRYDIKNRLPLSPALGDDIIEVLATLRSSVDAVVIIDQVEAVDCGVITTSVRQALSEMAVQTGNVIFIADSRARTKLFRNTIMKPNQYEATGIQRSVPEQPVDMEMLNARVKELSAQIQAPAFITCGDRGVMITEPELSLIPAVHLDGELDTTGAGDSAMAGIILALCSGATHTEAAAIGNLAASVSAEQLGTTGTASPEELVKRYERWIG